MPGLAMPAECIRAISKRVLTNDVILKMHLFAYFFEAAMKTKYELHSFKNLR